MKLLQLPHHYLHADNSNDTTYDDELTVSVSHYIVDYYRNFRGVDTMKLQQNYGPDGNKSATNLVGGSV